jgi:hypothetical protein
MKITVKPLDKEITVGQLARTGGFAKYNEDIIYVYPVKDGPLAFHTAFNFTENKLYSFKSNQQVELIHGEVIFTCP